MSKWWPKSPLEVIIEMLEKLMSQGDDLLKDTQSLKDMAQKNLDAITKLDTDVDAKITAMQQQLDAGQPITSDQLAEVRQLVSDTAGILGGTATAVGAEDNKVTGSDSSSGSGTTGTTGTDPNAPTT
jgi:hypothetical protein